MRSYRFGGEGNEPTTLFPSVFMVLAIVLTRRYKGRVFYLFFSGLMNIFLAGAPGLVIVEILVKIAKASGLSSRWLPLFSAVAGIAVAVIAKSLNGISGAWPEVVLGGLLTGSATAGLYDVTKKTIMNR